MNNKQKKALYESIIKSISKSVKKSINEKYTQTCGSYYVTLTNVESLVIGDPCYCLTEDIYDNVWGVKKYPDGILESDGEIVGIIQGTQYGDGSYESMTDQTYDVDSGTLGIFDIGYCKPEIELQQDESVQIFPADEDGEIDVELEFSEGLMTFKVNQVTIEEIYLSDNLDDEEEDYEDSDDEWDDDEEY